LAGFGKEIIKPKKHVGHYGGEKKEEEGNCTVDKAEQNQM
jgi:hypothetical protein